MKDILTQRLKRHDEAAFEEVMNKYLPLVSNIVYNIGRDRLSKEDMEETISDIFVILWNNTDKIIEGKLQGYLCRIARTKLWIGFQNIKSLKHLILKNLKYRVISQWR